MPCLLGPPGLGQHGTRGPAGLGVQRFAPKHDALGSTTIPHYTDCPCDCHKRLRSTKTNYLIAGRCANLCPRLMLFGNNLQRKENPWRENLRDAWQSCAGTDKQGTAWRCRLLGGQGTSSRPSPSHTTMKQRTPLPRGLQKPPGAARPKPRKRRKWFGQQRPGLMQ